MAMNVCVRNYILFTNFAVALVFSFIILSAERDFKNCPFGAYLDNKVNFKESLKTKITIIGTNHFNSACSLININTIGVLFDNLL